MEILSFGRLVLGFFGIAVEAGIATTNRLPQELPSPNGAAQPQPGATPRERVSFPIAL